VETFWGHLALLKAQFFFEKVIGPMINWLKISTFFNENKFDFGASIFKIIMQSNHATIWEPPLVCNPIM
jgi:hypothetical protein